MTEQYVFADVNLPFHVWTKEGDRWVLQDRGEPRQGEASCPTAEPSRRAAHRRHLPSRPRA